MYEGREVRLYEGGAGSTGYACKYKGMLGVVEEFEFEIDGERVGVRWLTEPDDLHYFWISHKKRSAMLFYGVELTEEEEEWE